MKVRGDEEAQEGTPRRGGERQEKKFVKEGWACCVEIGRGCRDTSPEGVSYLQAAFLRWWACGPFLGYFLFYADASF